MPLTITPEQLETYKRTARLRHARQQDAERTRREAAWPIAREAARILKAEFGATRVVVFGSLAHSAWFHLHSDLDLAAVGIAPERFLRAWIALDKIGDGYEIDLIDYDTAPERLRASIDRDGIPL